MQITPSNIFWLTLLALALTRLPGKYKPVWTDRLYSWQTLIGWVALIAAMVIMMNPEFYALGLLGDSAFFDLLVLAIACQLNMISSRIWRQIVAVICKVRQLEGIRICVTLAVMLFVLGNMVATVQKVVHRLIS